MKWDIRKVYLYLVSLVTFIMMLAGSVMLVNGLVDVIYPPPTIDPCAEALQVPGKDPAGLDPARCQELLARAEQREKVMRTRNLIYNVIFLVFVVPAYVYHWRQARRSETA